MTLLALLVIVVLVCLAVFVVTRMDIKQPWRNVALGVVLVVVLCLLVWFVAGNTGALGVLHTRV